MVKIKVSRNQNGYITKIVADGHSGYAEEGSDIVCAIVSTAVQSVVVCCEEVHKCDYFADIKDGYLKWYLKDDETAEKISVLTETLYRVLIQAQESYGSYISVKEVN